MNDEWAVRFILHPSYFILAFALLGDARILLFILNRVVFGSHRHEKNSWWWLLVVFPPLLLLLTWRGGAVWLIIAAAIGMVWVLDRVRVLAFPQHPPTGVRSSAPELVLPRGRRGINQRYDLEVTRHEIFIDDLPESLDGYRIAFLTDTHVLPSFRRDFYRRIAAEVQRFDPHLILLGGDFVTWHRYIPLIGPLLLADLHARDGIFAVPGNHDYWAGLPEIVEAMSAHGVSFLVNQRAPLPLQVVGIDEIYRGNPDIERTFAGIDPNQPCIAVSHHPDIIDLAGAHRIDLLLCGHTHGGQIRLPFFGAMVVPSRHEAAYASGFHRVRNVLLYVSRGIGAVPPIRILCRPEVATFVLRRGSRQS